jgi:hypothetical protein
VPEPEELAGEGGKRRFATHDASGRPLPCRIGPDGFYGSGWDWDRTPRVRRPPVPRAAARRKPQTGAGAVGGADPDQPPLAFANKVDVERIGALLDGRLGGGERDAAPVGDRGHRRRLGRFRG